MPASATGLLVNFAKQLNTISLLTFLLPVTIGFWRWHTLERPYRALVGFVSIPGFLLGVLAEIGRILWHNNIIFTYLIVWTETAFLYWLFYQTLDGVKLRRFLVMGFGIFLLVAIIEWLYLDGNFGSQMYTRVVQSVLLIGTSLLYFEQILQKLQGVPLHRTPMFLVSVGVTLYYAGTLMVFVLEDSMQKQHQWNQIWIMYIIQFALLIILNTLFAMALWYASQPKPQNRVSQLY